MLLMIKQIFSAGNDLSEIVFIQAVKYRLYILIGEAEPQMTAVQFLCGVKLDIKIAVKWLCVDAGDHLIDITAERKVNRRIGKEG